LLPVIRRRHGLVISAEPRKGPLRFQYSTILAGMLSSMNTNLAIRAYDLPKQSVVLANKLLQV